MKERAEFQELASTDNWIILGDWLNSVVENPSKYGFSYSEEALQAVADIRGTKAASLRNPIMAATWLQENHPTIHRTKPQWLGMMQVLLLARITSYSQEEAEKVAPKIFSGEMSQSEVKNVLQSVRTHKADLGSPINLGRHNAQLRSQLFDRSAKHFFKSHSDQLFSKCGLTVRGGRALEPLSTDLLVYEGHKVICAIEIRGPRLRVDPAYMIDQLARLALLLRKVPEVLYVVPEGSEYDLVQLEQTRARLEIDGVKFASLPVREQLKVSDLKFAK